MPFVFVCMKYSALSARSSGIPKMRSPSLLPAVMVETVTSYKLATSAMFFIGEPVTDTEGLSCCFALVVNFHSACYGRLTRV